jgi:hypothetical protein
MTAAGIVVQDRAACGARRGGHHGAAASLPSGPRAVHLRAVHTKIFLFFSSVFSVLHLRPGSA